MPQSPPSTNRAEPRSRPWRCWLAESLRLYEQDHGRLQEGAWQPSADVVGADEALLLERAQALAERAGLALPALPGARGGRGLLAVLLALAFGSGLLGALAVLGDGSRAVNIVWTWFALLGLPSVLLLLWLLSLALPRARAGGLARHPLAFWLRARARGRTALALRAWAGLPGSAAVARWGFAVASHALWAGLFLGMLAGLLVALSLRSYGFVWETTILPAAVFSDWVRALGALPAVFGFEGPSVRQVQASGGGPLLDAGLRRAWSSWLLGSVVVYGLLPRLLALAASGWRLRRAWRQVRLDLQQPYYQNLLQRWRPDHRRLGVLDPQQAELPRFRLGAAATAGSRRRLLAAIELGPDLRWPPRACSADDAGVIDSREQRRALLRDLQARPAERLLLVLDARQSPDRGVLALLAELSPWVGALRIVLAGAAEPGRQSLWRETLVDLGVEDAAIGADLDPALDWLLQEAHA